MPTRPPVYLSAAGAGAGRICRRLPSVIAMTSAGRPDMSIPIGTQTIVPACSSAISRPTLMPPKVTVTSARNAIPRTRPVSGSIPLGRSTATRSASVALACPTSSAASSRSGGLAPMPTTPSTITSADLIATFTGLSSVVRMRAPARRTAASPPAWVRSGLSSTAVTCMPRRRRYAPAYRASPPLLPDPTSSTTRRPGCGDGTRSDTSAATANDARRIRVSSPSRSRAMASTARICSTV